MGSLSITTTRALIGIQTTRAKFQVSNDNARIQMSSRPARFSMNTRLPRVKIDQSQSFASAGDTPILQLSLENAHNSLSIGLKGIGRMVDDGNYIGNMVNGGNRVAEVARRNSTFQYESNVGLMPSVSPQITLERQDLGMEWEPYQLDMGVTQAVYNYEYIPGSIEIFMAQWPDIQISYQLDDIAVGNYVDRVI